MRAARLLARPEAKLQCGLAWDGPKLDPADCDIWEIAKELWQMPDDRDGRSILPDPRHEGTLATMREFSSPLEVPNCFPRCGGRHPREPGRRVLPNGSGLSLRTLQYPFFRWESPLPRSSPKVLHPNPVMYILYRHDRICNHFFENSLRIDKTREKRGE